MSGPGMLMERFILMSVRLRTDREGNARLTHDGLQQHEYECLHVQDTTGEHRAKVFRIIVPGEVPSVRPMQPITFVNLTSKIYTFPGWSHRSYRADGVEPIPDTERGK